MPRQHRPRVLTTTPGAQRLFSQGLLFKAPPPVAARERTRLPTCMYRVCLLLASFAIGITLADGVCTACRTQCATNEVFHDGTCAAREDALCLPCPQHATCDGGSAWSCNQGYFWDGVRCAACRSTCPSTSQWAVPDSCGGASDTECRPCPPRGICDGGLMYRCDTQQLYYRVGAEGCFLSLIHI